MKNAIDLALSFDTTGSMYPCLSQVRRNVEKLVRSLFDKIAGIRIAIMAHGDYCDGKKVLTILDFSTNPEAICKFVRTVEPTNGGDSDECYEFVLNRARTLNWTSGKNKAFVLIGDANPHPVGYKCGSIKNDLEWENEADLLKEAGVQIISVQALGNISSNLFYNYLAKIGGLEKLELEQFSDVSDIIMAIAMSRAGKIAEFEESLSRRGSVAYSVLRTVDILAGRKIRLRKTSSYSRYAVHPSRFQMLDVDCDTAIKEFVEENELPFKKGRGFYEFTKAETVQGYKEVIIQDKATGEMFSGDKAREILGIPSGTTSRVRPEHLTRYRGFIQSTSSNRKLVGGTKFLYEVDEFSD